MDDSSADREPIVGEGRYAVVPAEDGEATDYWFVTEDGPDGVPLEDADLDDAYAALSRFRNSRNDSGSTKTGNVTELTCQECGKTWTYSGSDEHAPCPNCETEVPVAGIGP